MVFSTFTMLYNRHHYLIQNISSPRKEISTKDSFAIPISL